MKTKKTLTLKKFQITKLTSLQLNKIQGGNQETILPTDSWNVDNCKTNTKL